MVKPSLLYLSYPVSLVQTSLLYPWLYLSILRVYVHSKILVALAKNPFPFAPFSSSYQNPDNPDNRDNLDNRYNRFGKHLGKLSPSLLSIFPCPLLLLVVLNPSFPFQSFLRKFSLLLLPPLHHCLLSPPGFPS